MVLVPASDEIEIPLPVVVMLLLVMEIPELAVTEIEPQLFWLMVAEDPLLTEILLFALSVLFEIVAATKAVDVPPAETPCAEAPAVSVLFVKTTVVALEMPTPVKLLNVFPVAVTVARAEIDIEKDVLGIGAENVLLVIVAVDPTTATKPFETVIPRSRVLNVHPVTVNDMSELVADEFKLIPRAVLTN